MQKPHVTCIGAAHWDVIAQAHHPLRVGDDMPGTIRRTPGGVAFNIASALSKRGVSVRLISTVGADGEGEALLNIAKLRGIDVTGVRRLEGKSTDSYVAIEGSDGALFAAIADATLIEATGRELFDALQGHGLGGTVIVDGNLAQAALDDLTAMPILRNTDLRLVAPSPQKAPRLLGLMRERGAMVYANLAEANAMLEGRFADAPAAARALVEEGAGMAVVTNGHNPAAFSDGRRTVSAAPPPVINGNVTGAGDALVAGHIVAERSGNTPWDALNSALQAARHHMEGREA